MTTEKVHAMAALKRAHDYVEKDDYANAKANAEAAIDLLDVAENKRERLEPADLPDL